MERKAECNVACQCICWNTYLGWIETLLSEADVAHGKENTLRQILVVKSARAQVQWHEWQALLLLMQYFNNLWPMTMS